MKKASLTASFVLVTAAAGTGGFVTGVRFKEDPAPVAVSLDTPTSPAETRSCPPPVTCPPPDRHCKSLHDRAVHAVGKTLLADAYTRGAEDTHNSAKICEDALKERWPPTDVSCAACRYWDHKLDLMDLGVQVMALNVENSNWHRACEELYKVWPTEPEELGRYPTDFPEFCQ